jgi:imidazolonepropionase-like amidohydrolase
LEINAYGALFIDMHNHLVLFGSKNVRQMVMVMVSARLLAVTNLNRLVSNFSVVSDYGWTKTNMI